MGVEDLCVVYVTPNSYIIESCHFFGYHVDVNIICDASVTMSESCETKPSVFMVIAYLYFKTYVFTFLVYVSSINL